MTCCAPSRNTCWLNLQEAWWRIFRRHALAGQTFAEPGEIAQATAQFNSQAEPGLWNRGGRWADPCRNLARSH
jgi:hypothetical protein